MFNNYYRNNDYGVGSVTDAGVVVEGNYFSGKPQTRGTVAKPRRFYRYTLDDPARVPAIVARGAGVGKMRAGQ